MQGCRYQGALGASAPPDFETLNMYIIPANHPELSGNIPKFGGHSRYTGDLNKYPAILSGASICERAYLRERYVSTRACAQSI